jgi:hypothetical protein
VNQFARATEFNLLATSAGTELVLIKRHDGTSSGGDWAAKRLIVAESKRVDEFT